MIEKIKRSLMSFGKGLKDVPEAQSIPKGRTHNVIVVRPKNEIFTQVIFIMRDDYFSASALPQEELLQRARQAAGIYIPPLSYRGRRARLITAVLSVLLMLETAGIIIYVL